MPDVKSIVIIKDMKALREWCFDNLRDALVIDRPMIEGIARSSKLIPEELVKVIKKEE